MRVQGPAALSLVSPRKLRPEPKTDENNEANFVDLLSGYSRNLLARNQSEERNVTFKLPGDSIEAVEDEVIGGNQTMMTHHEIEGVDPLLQAEESAGYDYLNGLQINTKKRYFPQIAQKTERCRNNTMVANTNIHDSGSQIFPLGQAKRDKNLHNSFMQGEVPHAGSWFKRKPSNQNGNQSHESPNMTAGLNMPKSMKLSFADKIPNIKMELQFQNMQDGQIKQEIQNRKQKAIEKYGNRDRVGLLIAMENPDPEDKIYSTHITHNPHERN
jgi:hypothetical protein